MVAGLRPLLPDRALLPGRGPARRPAAGVHPDRHRGVVRRRRRTCSASARGWSSALWDEAGHDGRRAVPAAALRARRWSGTAPTSPTCATGSRSSTLTERVPRGADFVVTRRRIDARRAGARASGCRAARRSRRKQVDELEAAAKSAGRGGLSAAQARRRRARRAGREVPRRRRRSARSGCAEGDLLLARGRAGPRDQPGARPRAAGGGAPAGPRSPTGVNRFVWIVDFPLFERDPDDRRARARCTTRSPRRIRTISPLLETAPGAGARAGTTTWCYNGTELGGGSIRITDPALQRRIFGLLGIAEDEARAAVRLPARGARAPARRRTAASRSASTGSRCCWRARRRCAT